MPTLQTLSRQVQHAFAFLPEGGLRLKEERFTGGDSYRDGFSLEYASATLTCDIEYSDMEFTVSLNGSPIFGARSHPGFAGNMFSREHLAEHLPQLAQEIGRALAAQSNSAA
jgi:hypothetical protein